MALESNLKSTACRGPWDTRGGLMGLLFAAAVMSVPCNAAEARTESCESLARMYARNPNALDIARLSRLQECVGRELAHRLGYPGGFAPPLMNPEAQPPGGGSSPPLPVLPPPPEPADTPPYSGGCRKSPLAHSGRGLG